MSYGVLHGRRTVSKGREKAAKEAFRLNSRSRRVKRLVTLVVSAALLSLSGVAAAAPSQADLLKAVAKPDGVLTRGEFAQLLVAASGMGQAGQGADLLAQKGILKGAPGAGLALERPITRVEAVALVGRTLGLTDDVVPPQGTATQLLPGHWGFNLYAWVSREGLVSGDPAATLSEKEGAAFLSQVFTTDQDVLDIMKKSQARSKEINAMRAAMSGSMKLIPRPGAEGADELPSIAPSMQITQEVVLPDRIHQTSTVKMTLPDGKEQAMTTEMYLADGEMYQKLPDPKTGKVGWFRYPKGLMPDLTQLLKQAQQQTEVIPPGMEDYLHYKLLGTTEIGGQKAYEIAFYGRVDDFQKFLSAALGQFAGAEEMQKSLAQATQMIDSFSFWGITYVGAADYLTKKAEYSMVITYAPKFQGEEIPIQALQMSMQTDEYTYDPNLKLEVPAEVLEAPELELPENTVSPGEPSSEQPLGPVPTPAPAAPQP